MAIRIEEAFNDCFERLSLGESLDSCLRSYPEHAMELDMMLRTAFDVKRRAYPIQPRPEFKYWSRVRLQGVQDYMSRHVTTEKASPFNFRRNLAISVAGLLVLVIASSGTAAASNDAMPDQPLYGVKMAVEQAQLAIAVSDVDKAMLYASLAEKRAHEIEAMARQGKADYLISTSTKMDYQLEQAETYISKYQAANTAGPATNPEALPTETTTTDNLDQAVQSTPAPTTQIAPPSITSEGTTEATAPGKSSGGKSDQTFQTTPDTTTRVKPPYIAPDGKTGSAQPATKQPLLTPGGAANITRAKTALNSSTAKSLATLQDALEKAPESAKPAIIKAIERVKKANEWSQPNLTEGRDNKLDIFTPRPDNFPLKPPSDSKRFYSDNKSDLLLPDKPKYIPQWNKQSNPSTDTTTPSVIVPSTQIKAPVTTSTTGSTGTGIIKTPANTNTTGTVVSPTIRDNSGDTSNQGSTVITNTVNSITTTGTREGSGDSSTIKVLSK